MEREVGRKGGEKLVEEEDEEDEPSKTTFCLEKTCRRKKVKTNTVDKKQSVKQTIYVPRDVNVSEVRVVQCEVDSVTTRRKQLNVDCIFIT